MSVAGWLATIALAASPAPSPLCLTGPEAEALALVALPEIIRGAGTACATQLPATSLVRQPASALLARYDAEADRAWPAARAAIVKLSDPAIDALLQSQFARGVLATLVTPLLIGRIAPRDCGTIDRLVTLLAPLPPRNTAGVIVAALRYLKADPAAGKDVAANLPLCPAAR